MLDYLVNYGIQKTNIDFDDIDINDRLQLQEQINTVRSNYKKLLNLLDDIQGKYLECSNDLSARTKELIISNEGVKNNSMFMMDDAYMVLEAKQEALKTGMSMVNSQIEYCKSDLRILNSVFYNKF